MAYYASGTAPAAAASPWLMPWGGLESPARTRPRDRGAGDPPGHRRPRTETGGPEAIPAADHEAARRNPVLVRRLQRGAFFSKPAAQGLRQTRGVVFVQGRAKFQEARSGRPGGLYFWFSLELTD